MTALDVLVGAAEFAAGVASYYVLRMVYRWYRDRVGRTRSAPLPIYRYVADGATSWLDRQVTRELIVHTIDEHTVRGLLSEVSPDGVVLHAAQYLRQDGAVDLAGDIYVPRAKVRFVQRTGRDDA